MSHPSPDQLDNANSDQIQVWVNNLNAELNTFSNDPIRYCITLQNFSLWLDGIVIKEIHRPLIDAILAAAITKEFTFTSEQLSSGGSPRRFTFLPWVKKSEPSTSIAEYTRDTLNTITAKCNAALSSLPPPPPVYHQFKSD